MQTFSRLEAPFGPSSCLRKSHVHIADKWPLSLSFCLSQSGSLPPSFPPYVYDCMCTVSVHSGWYAGVSVCHYVFMRACLFMSTQKHTHVRTFYTSVHIFVHTVQYIHPRHPSELYHSFNSRQRSSQTERSIHFLAPIPSCDQERSRAPRLPCPWC